MKGGDHDDLALELLLFRLGEDLGAFQVGELDVQENQFGALMAPALQGFLPCVEDQCVVAFSFEVEIQGARQGRVVIHDHDFLHVSFSLKGKTSFTSVPLSGRHEIEISPPWASMIFFTMHSPRPVPFFLVVKKG